MDKKNASNYAAQAERAAYNIYRKFEKSGNPNIGMMKATSLGIIGAQHFSLPNGGRIFDDGLKLLVGTNPRLPFESITAEYISGVHRVVVLAFERPTADDIEICFVVAASDGATWAFLPFVSVLKEIHENGELTMGFYDSSGWIEADGVGNRESAYAVRCVLELCEALSCANVTHEVIDKVNPAMNARRIRAGKLPIYETRQLVINAGKSVASKSDIGGTHASPRQHLRRGHIRRLADKNIWVNSCVVSASNPARIEKTYAVRP